MEPELEPESGLEPKRGLKLLSGGAGYGCWGGCDIAQAALK